MASWLAGLLLLTSAPGPAAHQTFLPLIPNAEDFPQVLALGHRNKVGGGPLNAFGESFRRHKFVWSLEMCIDDADGDGETNGQELGDPCCTWKEGDRPPRSWGLSHPGDAESTCKMLDHPVDSAALLKGLPDLRSFNDLSALLATQGLDCGVASASTAGVAMTSDTQADRDAEFWKFYFRGEKDPAPPVSLGAALRETALTVFYPLLHPVAFVGDVVGGVVGAAVDFVDAAQHGGLYKHGQKVFTLAVLLSLAQTLRAGGATDLWRASRTEKLKIALLSTLWVEFISGLLHITFDNPAFQHTPFIGAMARDFQWHHKKPTHICNQTWPKFLGAIDSGIVVLFVIGTFIRPKHRWMRMFTLVSFPLFYLMMASHRWSHIRRDQLPALVALLQQSGILLSQEVHSVHHANYDQNFSLMTGWSNPFINWACVHVMGPKNTTWAYLFLGWTAMPGWLPGVVERLSKRAKTEQRLSKD